MVSDTDTYRQVLDRRGPSAQALLNLLQAVRLPTNCLVCAIDTNIP